MRRHIRIEPGPDGFTEDKDAARTLRLNEILPALDRGDSIVLDFDAVTYATQSFVHALIGEPLKKHGEPALDRIEFKNCSPQLQTLVEFVVDYSLGEFTDSETSDQEVSPIQ